MSRDELLQAVLTERYGPILSAERELTRPVPAPVARPVWAPNPAARSQQRLECLQQRLLEERVALTPLSQVRTLPPQGVAS